MTDKDKQKGIEDAALAGAAAETVQRYGSAAKEHFVSYSGVDNETHQTLKKGLKQIAKSKVNPKFSSNNVKQQAGFSAEVKYTARENAEFIIKEKSNSSGKDFFKKSQNKKTYRYSRTDDLGNVNDPLFDHVLLDERGIEIPGTGEQMKFIGSNPKECLSKLRSKKFQKYVDADAKITVPSDYYEGIIEEADKSISRLEKQLERTAKDGNVEAAEGIRDKIANLKKIKSNIKNSGITNKEAIEARIHPKISVAKDVVKLSHRAGVEQAKMEAAISGGVSLVRNVVAVIKGDKNSKQAACDLVKDTGEGAATSYAIAFVGSALKGGMQNASNATVRVLSKTNMPAVIATSALEVGKSMKRYIKGDIDGAELLIELGEKGTCNLSAAMYATAGQALIPIPVVGAIVGSMVGYAMASSLYNELVTSLKEAKLAHERRLQIEDECKEAIAAIDQFKEEMNNQIGRYLTEHRNTFNEAFKQMDAAFEAGDIDSFIQGANRISIQMGATPQYENIEQFNNLMLDKSTTFKL